MRLSVITGVGCNSLTVGGVCQTYARVDSSKSHILYYLWLRESVDLCVLAVGPEMPQRRGRVIVALADDKENCDLGHGDPYMLAARERQH